MFIIFFGVFISLYRHFIKDVVKYNQILIGFYRIEIALNVSKENTLLLYEIINLLGKDAFTNVQDSKCKDKKIENPMPGHYALDTLTNILNKMNMLMDNFSPTKTSG